MPPAPGISPSSVPTVQPIACERAIFFIIGSRGRRTRMDAFGFIPVRATPLRIISSVTHKVPTMIEQRLYAVEQVGKAEGEAVYAGNRIGADG